MQTFKGNGTAIDSILDTSNFIQEHLESKIQEKKIRIKSSHLSKQKFHSKNVYQKGKDIFKIKEIVDFFVNEILKN